MSAAMPEEYDVICVGAGPAGEALTSALQGSGLSLAVVESNLVGGECPYWGCMPSKTQLRSAETLAEADRARELAASRVEVTADFDRIHRRVRWMTRELDDAGAARALEHQGARLIRGQGRVTGPRDVDVDGRRLRARRGVVIATGTAPARPPIPGLKTVPSWTNREAVQASALPASLAVIGTGAVGVELAQAFARFGTRVHMVEGMDRILPSEEPEASRYLREALVSEGVTVTCGARIDHLEPIPSGVRIHLASGEPIEAAQLLVAAGRHPNTDGFDLAAAGLQADRKGFIQVDPSSLQAADGIYAIGDINGLGGFTHLSDYHGHIVGRLLRGQAVRADHTAVPRVTFTDPEIASVGVSEAQAMQRGLDPVTATAEVGSTARGFIHGEPNGCLKLVADRRHNVLIGATIASPRAGEMLSEISLAIKAGVPLDVMADLIHPFPTFSRVFQGMLAELVAQTSATSAPV